jgi:hypothetical protein
MIPKLTAALCLATLGVRLLPGLHYHAYVGFAIMAGSSPDRYGARFPIFVGVLTVVAGSVLLGLGSIGTVGSGGWFRGPARPLHSLVLANIQETDLIWAGAIVLSLTLTFFLRETGAGARQASATLAASTS